MALPVGTTALVDDERRRWLERVVAAASLQAKTLRAGDEHYHHTLLEDLDDLCRRIEEELGTAPRTE